jgi:type II secretory pathway pseudopilin PulG
MVVIALVAVFSGVLLKRFVMYQELAERAAMEQTVATIRSALHLQMAGMISRGRVADIPKLAAVNPFQLLAERQKNYAGEFFDPKGVSPGNWYYDLRTGEVVYLIRNGAHFAADGVAEKAVHFKAKAVYSTAFAGASTEIGGIAFHETRSYRWDIRL